MDDLMTREALDKLKIQDHERYQKVISQAWKTEEVDIAKIKAIMASYAGTQEKNTIQIGDKPFPKWALDAYEYFVAKYGKIYGEVIYEKALSKIWDFADPNKTR